MADAFNEQFINIGSNLAQQLSQSHFPPEYYMPKPMPKTNYLKKAFSYRGAVAWNNLPTAIKNSESINIFKAKLKDNKCILIIPG